MSKLIPFIDPSVFPMPTGDPSVKTTVLGSIWPMFIVSSLFLATRLYCRLARTKQAWWDDWLLLIGWAFLAGSLALQTYIFPKGYLYTRLGDDQITPANIASDSLIKISLVFTKTSFALTLIRLVGDTRAWITWVVAVLTFLTNGIMLAHAITVWRRTCGQPVNSYTFSPCWPKDSPLWMNFALSIVSGVSDFALSFVPLAILWNLKMAKREKIGVAIAMSMGVVAGILAIAKAIVTLETIKASGPDVGWKLMVLTIYIHAEVNAAIIATSIPILRTLFRDVKRKYARGRTSGRQYIRSNTQSKFHSESQGRTTITANEEDCWSEASVARLGGAKNGIVRSKQISVSHEDRGAGNEDDREWFELQQNQPQKRGVEQ